ncbi:MAG: HEAT repeat domain-containing protein [Acidobacteriia bacterium]|nr:HEAT repeat domain-containing protein [Terriglobia bacterium]
MLKNARTCSLWVSAISLMVVTTSLAQVPHFTNARVQTLSASTGLEREFRALLRRQAEPAWAGYTVPMIPGGGTMCCYESNSDFRSSGACGRCQLEDHAESFSTPKDGSKSVKLESPELLIVLFRLKDKNIQKIRFFSQECELDAGGLPVYWLTEVRPSESVAWLSTYATDRSSGEEEQSRHLRNSAVAAIALHADEAADRALSEFVAPAQPEALRRDAVFWLGSARGKRGFEVVQHIVHEDPSEKVREHALIALSISKEPQAVDTMIEVAHQDGNSHVRGQALFWLAHKAGQKAVGAITDAIEKDPETEVKRRAVFALSQLPKDEGVPKLIEVARTNRNPAVRKQAIFWLGQSKDPRALAFFEEILLH